MTIELELPALPPTRVRHSSMAMRVYDTVRAAIAAATAAGPSAVWKPNWRGSWAYRASRCARRFIKLADAGLVEVRPQRGTFVKLISIREVNNARLHPRGGSSSAWCARPQPSRIARASSSCAATSRRRKSRCRAS